MIRGKKGDIGQDEFLMMFAIILSVLVLLGMILMAIGQIQNTTFEKNFYARDISLLLDTLYAAPGDVEILYTLPEKKILGLTLLRGSSYTFEITENVQGYGEVIVSEDGNKPEKYFFAVDRDFEPIEFRSGDMKAIRFKKIGNEILIEAEI